MKISEDSLKTETNLGAPSAMVQNTKEMQKNIINLAKPVEEKIFNFKYILTILFFILIISILFLVFTYLLRIKEKQIKKENKCPAGFFIPIDDKTLCYKCNIQNCKTCIGEISNNSCISCIKGFTEIYENNNEGKIINCLSNNNNCGNECEICNYNEKICSKCFSGYYIPNDDEDKLNCKKCSTENCEECQGTKNSNFCIKCKSNFIPKYNENNIIENCNIKCSSGSRNCQVCNEKENECSKCNNGYYIPSDSEMKLECEKCFIENCKICEGRKNSNICLSCMNNYLPIYENGEIKSCYLSCELGLGEKCLSCSQKDKECAECNNGFYMPIDETDKSKCSKCSIDNCKICHGTKNNNICDNCEENFETIIENEQIKYCKNISYNNCEIGEKEKCLTCSKNENSCGSCNPSYSLYNGKCIYNPDNITFTAFYFSDSPLENVKLINENKVKNIEKIIVDGKKVDINNVDNEGFYNFQSIGEHRVDISLKLDNDTFHNLFSNCIRLLSISFFPIVNDGIKINTLNFTFSGCKNLKKFNISYIDTSFVEGMIQFCYNCKSLISVDLSNNNFEKVIEANESFSFCNLLTSINMNTKFSNLKSMNQMFYCCSSLKSIDFSSLGVKKLKDLDFLFYNCSSLESINLENFYTDQVIGMGALFYNCKLLTSIGLSSFYTQNVEWMDYMFYGCSSLTSLDISNFNTRKITNMKAMFYNCSNLRSFDFDNFDTSKVIDMSYSFAYCSSLTSINLKNFDTSQVVYFAYMFHNCTSLTSLDFSNFSFQNLKNHPFYNGLPQVFTNCTNLSYLDISSVTRMYSDNLKGLPSSGIIKYRSNLQSFINSCSSLIPNWTKILVN